MIAILFSRNCVRIWFVRAGFSAYYSVDVVVRAFAEVKEIYPEAKLDLVGGGPAGGRCPQIGGGVETLGRELYRRRFPRRNWEVLRSG